MREVGLLGGFWGTDHLDVKLSEELVAMVHRLVKSHMESLALDVDLYCLSERDALYSMVRPRNGTEFPTNS